jgi:hypothetical protein
VTREGNLYAGDNPLYFGNQQGESSVVKPDNNFISNLVQEMMKALGEKQNGTVTSQIKFSGNVTVTKEMSGAKLCALSAWLIDSGA